MKLDERTRLEILMEKSQKGLLVRLAAKTGAPVSELVRRAIGLYLSSPNR